ncbi:MAG: DUF1592 domain-containing protein [Deltaproteobacteria bacterium]|nr:DUF1592 domain-containing protein [Deltaproteobacteria bacterium]
MKRRILSGALLALAACGQPSGPPPPPLPPQDAGRDVTADVSRDTLPADRPAPDRPLVVAPGGGEFQPPRATLRRLTQAQYRNCIQDLYGEDIAISRPMEPDSVVDGFASIGAAEASISPRGVEQYEALAYDLAEQLLVPARRARTVGCTPAGPIDDACARAALAPAGRRLWRRPLSPEELDALVAVARRAAMTLGDFHQGLGFAFAALLQSPDFLFRVELGVPDRARPDRRVFVGHELASRLAFFLWNGPPDDALLDAAVAGALDTPEGLASEARRLLLSPKARRGLRSFVTEWLELARLDDLTKDTQLFPSFSPELGPAAREQTLRDFERMAFDLEDDWRELLVTRETHVTHRLAAVYAVPGPARETDGFRLITLPENSPRRGLLGQVSVLALRSHPVATSPTLRGRFIREGILCGFIPPPPVDVNTALPAPSMERRSLRERLQLHLSGEACAGCHIRMDPLGLGLEPFDAIGRFRRMDNGVVIDASGRLDGMDFRDFQDLTRRLREHPDAGSCMVTHLYRYATGHVEGDPELSEIDRLTAFAETRGNRLREIMFALATSDGFRRAGPTAEMP